MSGSGRGPHGISLWDLLAELREELRGPLSAPLRGLFQLLSASGVESWASGSRFVHSGIVHGLAEQGIEVDADLFLELPGLRDGIPFTLTLPREGVPGGDAEPPPDSGQVALEDAAEGWTLDLFVERIGVRVPGLIPAIRVPSAPGRPARLERRPAPGGEAARADGVRLLARGVVRIAYDGSDVDVRILPPPDPLDPDAADGTVVEFSSEPPHVLLDESGVGVTVEPVLWDDSLTWTPARVVERGHDARWRGLATDEITVYLPHNLPILGDVSFGARGLILGWGAGGGVQGDFVLELGQTVDSPAAAVVFHQRIVGDDGSETEVALGVAPTPSGWSSGVVAIGLHQASGPTATVRASMHASRPGQGSWTAPGTRGEVVGRETEWFTVPTGSSDAEVRYRRVVTDAESGEQVVGPPAVYRFVPPQPLGEDTSRAPWIGVRAMGTGDDATPVSDPPAWPNVTELQGPLDAIRQLELVALAPHPHPDPGVPEAPPPDPLPFSPLEGDEVEGSLRWLVNGQEAGAGTRFSLAGLSADLTTVTLRREGRDPRILRIRPSSYPSLLVGRETAVTRVVWDEATGQLGAAEAVLPDKVGGTGKLEAFHRTGVFEPGVTPGGEITPSGPEVPPGTIAEMILLPEPPEPPSEWNHERVLRVFSELAQPQWTRTTGRIVGPGMDPPPGGTFAASDLIAAYENQLREAPTRSSPPDFSYAQLRRWIARFPEGTTFAVVGRCCERGSDELNETLATKRAKYWSNFLRQFLLDPKRYVDPADGSGGGSDEGGEPDPSLPSIGHLATAEIYWRGEWDAWTPSPSDTLPLPPSFRDVRTRRNGPAMRPVTVDERETNRQENRGAEIYAMVPAGVPLLPPDEGEDTGHGDGSENDPENEVILVPGADLPPGPPPPPPPPQPGFPFRFLVRGRWDSPAFQGGSDFLPSLVEMEFDWVANPTALPGQSEPIQPEPTGEGVRRDEGTNAAIFRILGRFSHDVRTGQTLFGLAWDSPGDDRGIFHLVRSTGGIEADPGVNEFVAVAMGLGPALLGSLEPSDRAGQGVALAGLLAGAGIVIGLGIVRQGRVTVQKLEAELETPGLGTFHGMRLRATMDYHAAFSVTTAGLLGGVLTLVTTEPVEMRYKRVGLEFREDEDFPDNVNFLFGDVEFQVANPGRWELQGDLGRLLGISALRLGTGSVWIEVVMEPGLDLGVVKITEATVRLTVRPSEEEGGGSTLDFELRGLAASIDIPGVLKGSGRLALGDGGSISAALALDLIPAKLKVDAALRIQQPMVEVEVGVILPVGLPIGATGLGVFGFRGRFVSNGTRDLESSGVTDPVERELAWWRRPSPKYRVEEGQYALGLGVVVGTLPDTGFTFHAQGMLVVEFPEPSVVLGIEARFASEPTSPAEEGSGGESTDVSFTLLGLVAVDRRGIAIAIRGELTVPEILRVSIPISAYFPFQGEGGYYIHIGSDGVGDRAGEPVTAVILPGSLDLRVWTFLMIREKGIIALGGREELVFEGFSIGFGAGWELRWGEPPLYIRVAATFLMGLGTRPFRLGGFIEVVGELFLLVLGIGLRGHILLVVDKDSWLMNGEFCGKVSLLFFTIEECVQVQAGSGPPFADPPPLLDGIGLTDHLGRLVRPPAGANGAPGAFEGDVPVAWPDALPTLHFHSRLFADLATDTGFRPDPDKGWSGLDEWVGTDTSRTLFRLRGLYLEEHTGGDWTSVETEGWPSVWWLPSFRAAVPEPGDTAESANEGWDLALLTRDPVPTTFENLMDGGEGVDADPADALENLCRPAPAPGRHCVHGAHGRRAGVVRVNLASPTVPTPPYTSSFHLVGREGFHHPSLPMEDLVTFLELMGFRYTPGRRRAPFPGPGDAPVETPAGPDRGSWELPFFLQDETVAFTPGMEFDIRHGIHEPELILAACLDLPPQARETTRCVDFRELQVGTQLPSTFDWQGLRIQNTLDEPLIVADALPANLPDGLPEVIFRSKGVDIALNRTAHRVRVRVGFLDQGELVVRVRDAAGQSLAVQAVPEVPGVVHTVELAAEGIRSVHLESGRGQGNLVEICVTGREPVKGGSASERFVQGAQELAATPSGARRLPGYLPLVEGWTEPGDPPVPGGGTRWTPEVLGSQLSGDTGCVYLRYRPRDLAGAWHGLRILPFPYLRVRVIRVCGVSVAARRAHAADEARRERMQDLLAESWSGGGGDPDDPERGRYRPTRSGDALDLGDPPMLRAGTRYRVRVELQEAQWLDDGTDGSPPEPGAVNWDSADSGDVNVGGSSGLCIRRPRTEYLEFRTAGPGDLPDDDRPDTTAQWAFDPRAVDRYILGTDPGGDRPTHFLDDLLRVHFGVSWVPALLAAYGLELNLRVRRTDPGPSPRPDGVGGPPFLEPLPLDLEGVRMRWGPLPPGLLTPMERRLAEVTEASPCLPERPSRGRSVELDAPLEPQASYDLIVGVQPVGGSPEHGEALEVFRTHFRTSRYPGPGELLEGAGFGDEDSPGLPPMEHLLVPDHPSSPVAGDLTTALDPLAPERLADDSALDEALAFLGMDPWPLPDEPGVVVIWRMEADGGFAVVGALVDSDEALIRERRFEDPASGLELVDCHLRIPRDPPVAGARPNWTTVPLELWRRNEAGTRLLFLTTAEARPTRTANFTELRLRLELGRGPRRWVGDRLVPYLPQLVLHEEEG